MEPCLKSDREAESSILAQDKIKRIAQTLQRQPLVWSNVENQTHIGLPSEMAQGAQNHPSMLNSGLALSAPLTTLKRFLTQSKLREAKMHSVRLSIMRHPL